MQRVQFDGLGIIVEGPDGLYMDTAANFATDSGAPFAGPVGLVYVPGKINKTSDGENDGAGYADTATLDALITAAGTLAAAKATREAAAAAAAQAAMRSTQAWINADAKAQLDAIDVQSVRALREFILSKFAGDPLLPPQLATHNNDAATQRARIH